MPGLSDGLQRRLHDAGIDFARPGGGVSEVFSVWLQLRAHCGRRATLVDLYELEAARRGVRPEDLPASETREGYESIAWSKGQICAVLKDNILQALVVRQPARAENGRGLRVGDNESKLESLYSEKPEIGTADAPPSIARGFRKSASWIKVYRYNALGIGFEVRDEKVRSITLFPPQPD